MVLYLKPFAAVVAYLIIFGLVALVGYIPKKYYYYYDIQRVDENSTIVNASSRTHGLRTINNNNILKGVLQSCVSILCISFSFLCYLIYKRTSLRFRSVMQKMHGENPYWAPSSPDETQEISITISGAWNHHYLSALWLSIFCASYSIDPTNLNAGFFFSVSSGLVSCACSLKRQYLKNETASSWLNSLRCLFIACIFIIYVVCFASWSFFFYLQHDANSSEPMLNARYMWFEIIFPISSPAIISFLKGPSPSKKKNFCNGGFNHLLVALPFLTFTSMLILTVYLTFASTSINDILTIDSPLYFTLYFIAAPSTLCMALVIYIAAMGQTEYCMISSSSLCLIFFLYSNWDLPVELQNKNNVILPCCTMCLIGVLLSLALLILNMYYQVKDPRHPNNDTPEEVEHAIKHENEEDFYGCEYYHGDNDDV
jgi:hypothetical protein